MDMIVCPVCNSKAMGKLTNKQFYCWDCCYEFTHSNVGFKVFQVLDDGTLVTVSLDEARETFAD